MGASRVSKLSLPGEPGSVAVQSGLRWQPSDREHSLSSIVLTWSLQARCQGLVKVAVQLVVGSIGTVTTWSVHKRSMGQLEVAMLLGRGAEPSSVEYYQSLIGVYFDFPYPPSLVLAVNRPPFIRSLDLLTVSAF